MTYIYSDQFYKIYIKHIQKMVLLFKFKINVLKLATFFVFAGNNTPCFMRLHVCCHLLANTEFTNLS